MGKDPERLSRLVSRGLGVFAGLRRSFPVALGLVLAGCSAPRIDSPDPEVRQKAVLRLTDQASLARIAVEDDNWRVREAARDRLTDQAMLASVAMLATHGDGGWQSALRKVTDQAMLARVVQGTRNPAASEAALQKLTDQDLLSDIAVEAEGVYPSMGIAAAGKVTDQVLLGRIVSAARHPLVRRAAVEQLADQARLATIAIADEDPDVRSAALTRTEDDRLLAQIARDAKTPAERGAARVKIAAKATPARVAGADQGTPVDEAAVNRTTDQALLARIAMTEANGEEVRRLAVSRITDEALLALVLQSANYSQAGLLAGERLHDVELLSFLRSGGGLSGGIAGVNLAMRDSRISARYPHLSLTVTLREESSTYKIVTSHYESSSPARFGAGPNPGDLKSVTEGLPMAAKGHAVQMKLRSDSAVLAEKEWTPELRDIGAATGVPRASMLTDVEISELLRELLSRPAFTQDDLKGIALESGMAELREAAIWNLKDQPFLARFAAEEKQDSLKRAALNHLRNQEVLARLAADGTGNSRAIRVAAIANLTDQARLSELASDHDPAVRMAAVQRVTDEPLLAGIYATAKDRETRSEALSRMTSESALAGIATGETDEFLRTWAVGRLASLSRDGRAEKSLALLTRIAVEDPFYLAREAAVAGLTDAAVLARVALNDREPTVRLAAVRNLTDQTVLAQVATKDANVEVKIAAIAHLTDQAALATIADQPDIPYTVKEAALSQLNYLR